MAYWFYNLLVSLLFLVALPVIPFLFLLGERFRKGFLQRLGFYPREVRESLRDARPIWLHAVSVGEILSLRPLVGALKRIFPGRKVLVSTFTSTGYDIACRNGIGDSVIFLPLDHPWIVRRALALFEPSLLVLLETELWPNFLRLAHRRGVPAMLLSGRISPRAFRRYSFLRVFFADVVRQFNAVGMQREEDAERIRDLGLDPRRVWITGSLKHAFQEGGASEIAQGQATGWGSARENGRQIVVAGSTHSGEEEILVDAFLALKISFPALQMVLAPRHPQRFDEVERLLKRKNVPYEKKSQMDGRESGLVDVIFLDTLGELPAFYSLADIAFVGGSLVDAGGHNPMEPARFRKPVLFGPHMGNFADVAREMKQSGGGIEVQGREDLVREISGLLKDRGKAESMGRIAHGIVERDRGVMERSIALVSRYLHP